MPLEILIVIYIIGGFAYILWMINIFGVNNVYYKHGAPVGFGIATVLVIVLSAWLTFYVNTPKRVETVVTVDIVNVNGVQTAAVFNTSNDDAILINVTEKFGRVFPEDTKLKVTIYERGPYYGIWSPIHTIDYEIVTAETQ
ncbi:MAG: hypothetical protein WDA42_04205 [Candidatus Bathyarchaeia archaeon]